MYLFGTLNFDIFLLFNFVTCWWFLKFCTWDFEDSCLKLKLLSAFRVSLAFSFLLFIQLSEKILGLVCDHIVSTLTSPSWQVFHYLFKVSMLCFFLFQMSCKDIIWSNLKKHMPFLVDFCMFLNLLKILPPEPKIYEVLPPSFNIGIYLCICGHQLIVCLVMKVVFCIFKNLASQKKCGQ